MARSIERRGYTLQLRRNASDDARFVRLSLVERLGFLRGWFNVREARGETEPGERAIGDGRMLSWRWLRTSEAEALIEARLRSLEAMGYAVVDAGIAARGRWDWLYDLVRRGLTAAAEIAGEPAGAGGPTEAIRDALNRIGLRKREVEDGVAAVLGIAGDELRDPTAAVVANVDSQRLGTLLPFLLEHEQPEIRQLGRRWLSVPAAAYQLPRRLVERWLAEDGPAGGLLAARLPREGLALVGPDALLRLAHGARRAEVREAARRWTARLQ